MNQEQHTKRVGQLITEFRWVHTGLGLIGNLSFFVGSICFLWDGLVKDVGVWLFIVGAFGMLLGSLGEAVVKYERHRLNI
ncbi:MAG: YrhK family protein [Halofilum sp. (in: g-proteobacteria)]